MKHFIAIVEKDPDSAYGVRFPDIPGCFSAADEREDVLANATEALALHVEDLENVPEPSNPAIIWQEVHAEITSGIAYLLAVPLLTTSARQVRANISMDAATMEAIDTAAKARGLTRSSFIVEAVRNEISGKH